MEIYSTLNTAELTGLAVEAGRAAHMLRNYTQGQVNLGHPEVATCDNMCGQIEAQLRVLTAHLRERKEVKQILSIVGRTSVFLSKLLTPEFLADDQVDGKRLDMMVYLLKVVRECTRKIDSELNVALIKSSMKDFNYDGAELQSIGFAYDRSEFIKSHFDPMEALGKYPNVATCGERQEALFDLGSHMSNKAHQMQDAVSSYLIRDAESAKNIVNLAGQLENESRAVIAVSATHANLPVENVNKHLQKMKGLIDSMKEFTAKEQFSLKDLRPELQGCYNDHEAIINTTRAVLAARVA